MSIFAIIIIFSILIVAHEFGHFLAARVSGVKVEQFAIGFGPVLFKIRGKETIFLVCLFPLGGYVKLAGDTRSESKGEKFEFLSKAPGVKMRIVFAGPLFNYLLAFFLFWGSFTFFGVPSHLPVIGQVLKGYPADSAGLQAGDKVLQVNSRKVDNWRQMAESISQSKNEVSLTVERAGRISFFEVALKQEEITDEAGKRKNISIIGISAKIEKYNFVRAFYKGGESLFYLTKLTLQGFGSMILGKVSFKKAIAGPIGIFYFTSQAVSMGIVAVINLMIILNLSLAIVNLFPLPILDGGHICLFIIEKLRKKALNEKAENFITRAGFVLIGLLFVFVLYNDILKFGPKLWGKKTEIKGQMSKDKIGLENQGL